MKIYQQEDRKAESKGVFLSAYQPPPALRGWPCRTLRRFERTGNAHSEILVNGNNWFSGRKTNKSWQAVLMDPVVSAFPCWLIPSFSSDPSAGLRCSWPALAAAKGPHLGRGSVNASVSFKDKWG